MQIGLYTAFLTPSQIGGIETYLRQLVKHLAQVDRHNRYTLFVTKQNHHLFADLPYGFELAQISLLPPGPIILARLMHKLRLLPAYAARQMQRFPLDVLHYPGSTIDQPSITFPCVLTLHDIQHEYHPEFFSSTTLAWRKANFKPSAQKACYIITDSEYTRRTIIEKYNIPAHKTQTIHLGINKIFHFPVGPETINNIRQTYRLPEKFIFFPANAWPHKNHIRLFEAMKLLKQKYHITCKLVLSGILKSEQATLRSLIRQAGISEDIHILGYVPYQDLPGIYAAATTLVFPSLFEGFGIPVLEAMACGCPVICSNTTSLPELAGEAALLIDPLDVAQMAEAIYNIVTSKTLRSTLQTKGLEQVKFFSWRHTARETVKVYESIGYVER